MSPTPVRSILCRCGERHVPEVTISGIPLLRCPQAKGEVMRYVVGEDRRPVILVGEK